VIGNSRLLVFGVTHLGRGAVLEPDEALTGIVERIVRWRPDVIAVEVLPGDLIASYLRLGGPYAGMQVGGLPQAAACAEAVRPHHDWSLWQARTIGVDPDRSPAERATAWCAAYEPYTALLYAQTALDLPAQVCAALDAVAAKGSESWRIAGAAAQRLGLDRLHPFDDHSDGAAVAGISDADHSELMAIMAESARPYVAGVEAELEEALSRGELWPLWRRLNTPERVAASEQLESGLFLAAATPLARKLLAGWRTRNLLMAGRLRAVTGNHPGGRVLALVGHAHKGPMETALRTGQGDIDIADIAELDVML
jgi:hypothetical protein